LEGDDEVQGDSFRRGQEKAPQENQLGINELILQVEARGVPAQQKVERTEEKREAGLKNIVYNQRRIVGQEHNIIGGEDMELSPIRGCVKPNHRCLPLNELTHLSICIVC
jgi:hypothetical protein